MTGESGGPLGISAHHLDLEQGVKQWLDHGEYRLEVCDATSTPVGEATVRLSGSHQGVVIPLEMKLESRR